MVAWNISQSGDILLLNPTIVSWDQYKACKKIKILYNNVEVK